MSSGETAPNINQLEQMLNQSTFPFKTILLASSWHTVSDFVEKYKSVLRAETSKTCQLIFFEENPNLFKSVTPVPAPAGFAYTLAQNLGIPLNKLPCLLIFEQIRDDLSNTTVVKLPQDKDTTNLPLVFDNLLTWMNACSNNPPGKRLGCFKGKVQLEHFQVVAKGILKQVLSAAISGAVGAAIKVVP